MKEGALAPRASVGGAADPEFALTVVEPPRRWPGLALGELWRLRQICLVLTRRTLMVRYRQTAIGAGWSLLQPLLLMAVFTVFFGFLGRGLTEGLPFPIFYLLGLVPYQMVSKMLSEGSMSIVSNSVLVTRVYFPRAYFPTSVALAVLVDLGLSLIPVAALLLLFGIVPGPTVIFVPLLTAVAWFAGLGASYWLSALNVAYRDVTQLIPFLTQLVMFLSPIIYPSSIIPEPYRTIYFLNPLALVVEGFRWAIANAPAPPAYAWVLGPLVAATLLVTGYIFFRKREPAFADFV
jgi:lipopolysaccharide transport system permease protein